MSGFQAELYHAPFGQYVQQMIRPDSGLNLFEPDFVILMIRLQDVIPELYNSFNRLSGRASEQLMEKWQALFESTLHKFRQINHARIICANYEDPAYLSAGIADAMASVSQQGVIDQLNQWLQSLGDKISQWTVLDVNRLARQLGRDAWYDPKMWLLARYPISDTASWSTAGEVTCLLRAVSGKTRKVLALDCDETLWGGILGDVGIEGIQLGQDFPGSAYRGLQQAALDLYHRGVVLVIASKNNHDNVMNVFANHPEMTLRPDHISYFAVNWDPKPQNLKKSAQVLSLGIDSYVFVDDNPVECEQMRTMLPQVKTVHLPSEVAYYESTLRRLNDFDQVSITAEDRQRGQMYRQTAQRVTLQEQMEDVEDFYRQLDMKASVAVDDPTCRQRAAQLTQRTNQFNMTTVRLTEAQIDEVIADPDRSLYLLSLKDRFGDNGNIGLAIISRQSEQAQIDLFLMSCRVLGRTVEQAFLSWIAQQEKSRGLIQLVGLCQPSPKNGPFLNFYKKWGMSLWEKDEQSGREKWSVALSEWDIRYPLPDWIEFNTLEKE